MVELAFGMAIVMVVYRAIFDCGLTRTVVLIPYDIVTVVATCSWDYTWTSGAGYFANLLPDGITLLTKQWPPIFIIIDVEIWKMIPFMTLPPPMGLVLMLDDAFKAVELDDAGF